MGERRVAGQPEGAEQRPPAGGPADESRPPEGGGGEAVEETPAQRAEREAEELVEHDLDELAEARKERDEYLELARRTRADFENYRRRVASEAAEAVVRGKAELARELIPAIDNLERALSSAGIDPEADPGAGDPAGESGAERSGRDALGHGVALVYRELRSSLERAGVEAYDPLGEAFDPKLHEALTTRADEGAGSGVVLETVERGYRLDGQVLRAARVVVSE